MYGSIGFHVGSFSTNGHTPRLLEPPCLRTALKLQLPANTIMLGDESGDTVRERLLSRSATAAVSQDGSAAGPAPAHHQPQHRRGTVSTMHLQPPALARTDTVPTLVTATVQLLDDGTSILYDSRRFRKGRRPTVLLPSGEPEPTPPTRIVWCGWRPRSLPYWETWAYLVASIALSYGNLATLVVEEAPWVDAAMRGGLCWLLLGCYLSLVTLSNANLTVELERHEQGHVALHPTGSVHRRGSVLRAPAHRRSEREHWRGSRASLAAPPPRASIARREPSQLRPIGEVAEEAARIREAPINEEEEEEEDARPDAGKLRDAADAAEGEEEEAEPFVAWLRSLRWWSLQPDSLLWWGAAAQILAAATFCATALLPVGGDGAAAVRLGLVSVAGCAAFFFAAYVYLAEVTHSFSPLACPAEPSLGLGVAAINVAGALLFLAAAALGLAVACVAPGLAAADAWGRAINGTGSLCFVVSSVLGFAELLSD